MAASDKDDVSDIIDRIYDVAVDPVRFEEMLDRWEARLAAQRRAADQGGGEAGDAELEPHLRRAATVLSQVFRDEGDRRGPLDSQVTAAFTVGPEIGILAANAIAGEALMAQAGSGLDSLPLDAADIAVLQSAVRKVLRTTDAAPALLRFNLSDSDRSIVFHVSRLAGDNGAQALVRATELGWPEHLTQALRDAFQLSAAEAEIVRALAEGKSLKTIADTRQRSLATVRTQVSAILAKTETHSQTELVRITLGLMDVVDSAARGSAKPASPHLADIPYRTLTLPDGRRYDWIEFGSPAGRPLLFLPSDYGFVRWPARAEQAAARQNIRVIVPVRAGFGKSSSQPAVRNYTDATVADLRLLLAHLSVESCAVIALAADIRFAVALANAHPGLVRGIFGCTADLPILHIRQYERMHKWHRFALANARYAPRILPFMLKAGAALAWRMGKEAFFRRVNADSPGDLAAFADPEIKEAILAGSVVSLSADHSAHDAMARESIDSEINWADRLRACTVPIRLLQGADDPQATPETVREWADAFPQIEIELVENAGQLLFFQLWPRVLAEVERFLPN